MRFKLFLFLLIITFIMLFTIGPQLVERKENRTLLKPPYHASTEVVALHNHLRIADLHADSLLWSRNLLKRSSRGHVDIPRLIEGNVAIQAFTVVTKVPFGLNIQKNSAKTDSITPLAIISLWPVKTWTSLKARALYQAGRLQTFADESGGTFTLIKSRSDLVKYLADRKSDSSITAGFLGMEGAHAFEGDVHNLDAFYNAGYRMIAPVHFFDNEIGGSAHGINKGGLTPLGKELITEMEKKGIIVDLAHGSAKLIDDVLTVAHRPVLVSHTGVKATCNNQRNLSDQQVRRIAANGGLIGIGFWETAVCGKNISRIVFSIRQAAAIAGIDHVALGSDFDGAVTVPFDSTGMVLLIDEMLKQDFQPEEIQKIMGENVINFLSQNLPQ